VQVLINAERTKCHENPLTCDQLLMPFDQSKEQAGRVLACIHWLEEGQPINTQTFTLRFGYESVNRPIAYCCTVLPPGSLSKFQPEPQPCSAPIVQISPEAKVGATNMKIRLCEIRAADGGGRCDLGPQRLRFQRPEFEVRNRFKCPSRTLLWAISAVIDLSRPPSAGSLSHKCN
jgi:hypothetical protein